MTHGWVLGKLFMFYVKTNVLHGFLLLVYMAF